MKKKAAEMRRAVVCLDGWAGRRSVPVEVVGETPKRYLVRFLEATTLPHVGAAAIGEERLVPKYSVVLK